MTVETIIRDVVAAITESDLAGIGGMEIQGREDAEKLRAAIEAADANQAAALAYRLGLLVGTLRHEEIRRGLGAARERARAAERFDHLTIFRLADAKGWRLPVSRDRKSALQRDCVRGYGITPRSFRTHYAAAVAHAEKVEAQIRAAWLVEQLSEVRKSGHHHLRSDVSQAELMRLRNDYKARFDRTGRDFRNDLISSGLSRFTDLLSRAK